MMVEVRYRLNTLNGIKFYSLSLKQIENGFVSVLLKQDSYYDKSVILDKDLYVGIKDISGNKIFKSDILEYKDESGKQQKGIVKDYGYLKFYVEAINGDDEGNQDLEIHPDYKFKIVGNIYEDIILSNKSPTSQTKSRSDFPNGEHNKEYQVTPSASPKEFSTKIPSDNPNIKSNSDGGSQQGAVVVDLGNNFATTEARLIK